MKNLDIKKLRIFLFSFIKSLVLELFNNNTAAHDNSTIIEREGILLRHK